MSRIGNKPIEILEGIEITINPNDVIVKGKNGELVVPYESDFVKIEKKDNEILVSRKDETGPYRSKHGLYRSLLANAIEGASKDFEKKLQINGVGYRVAMQGTKLVFNLGFSHPVEYEPPTTVKVEIDKENQNVLIVSGNDKQKVGQVAAHIRAFKKPEPYKGKGIKYLDERIVRKAGKSGSKE